MHEDIKALALEAEMRYLKSTEIDTLQSHVGQLKDRLAVYKKLRDYEVTLFEKILVSIQIPEDSPEDVARLEQAIVECASALRYGAMAMLLNSPEFLQRRLLEFCIPMVEGQGSNQFTQKIYQLLNTKLREILSVEDMAYLSPFVAQVFAVLVPTEKMDVA